MFLCALCKRALWSIAWGQTWPNPIVAVYRSITNLTKHAAYDRSFFPNPQWCSLLSNRSSCTWANVGSTQSMQHSATGSKSKQRRMARVHLKIFINTKQSDQIQNCALLGCILLPVQACHVVPLEALSESLEIPSLRQSFLLALTSQGHLTKGHLDSHQSSRLLVKTKHGDTVRRQCGASLIPKQGDCMRLHYSHSRHSQSPTYHRSPARVLLPGTAAEPSSSGTTSASLHVQLTEIFLSQRGSSCFLKLNGLTALRSDGDPCFFCAISKPESFYEYHQYTWSVANLTTVCVPRKKSSTASVTPSFTGLKISCPETMPPLRTNRDQDFKSWNVAL